MDQKFLKENIEIVSRWIAENFQPDFVLKDIDNWNYLMFISQRILANMDHEIGEHHSLVEAILDFDKEAVFNACLEFVLNRK